MIAEYNRGQRLSFGFNLAIGIVCCVITYAVFSFLPPFVADQFDYAISPAVARLLGVGGLALVLVQGYRDWRDGGGSEGYLESTLSHDVVDSIGVIFWSPHCSKISAPAQLLTRFFLAGPTRLLKARSIWASFIPESPELSARLEQAQSALRAANRWQPITDYPGLSAEILYLARMGRIDFSDYQGIPRIKSR